LEKKSMREKPCGGEGKRGRAFKGFLARGKRGNARSGVWCAAASPEKIDQRTGEKGSGKLLRRAWVNGAEQSSKSGLFWVSNETPYLRRRDRGGNFSEGSRFERGLKKKRSRRKYAHGEKKGDEIINGGSTDR